MAVIHAKRTLVAPDANYYKFLGDLYAYFDVTGDGNWEIDPTVNIPVASGGGTTGDRGFVIRATADNTLQVAFGTYAGGGAGRITGSLIDGTAVAGGMYVLVGVCPGGGITNTTANMFGPRWSGWAKKQTGVLSTQGTIYKIVSGVDYLFVRFKLAADSKYTGGFFVGKALGLGARASGHCVIGGLWTEWLTTGINQASYEYDDTGRWSLRAGSGYDRFFSVPSNTIGMDAGPASDGAGNYNYSRVVFMDSLATGPASPYATVSIPVAACPCLFVGPIADAQAKRWQVGGVDTMVNMTGGSWMCLDDGTNAE